MSASGLSTARLGRLRGILLTQREMTSPLPPTVFRDFWTCAYQAIED
jgi:hypothetical protein